MILLPPAPVSAQEKIRITKGEEKMEIPRGNAGDDLLSRPFDELRSRGDGAGSLDPVLPSIPVNPRNVLPKDKTDDKNWIIPKGFDQDAVLKEIFKVRDYDLENRDKKSRTGFERILGVDRGNKDEKDGSGSLSLTPRSMEDQFGQKVLGPMTPEMMSRYRPQTRSPSDQDPKSTTDLIMELSFENLMRVTRPFEVLSQPTSDLTGMVLMQNAFGQTFNRLMPVRTPKTKQQEQSSKDFQKLLGSSRQFLTSRLNDPLNSQSDETRLEVNPVTGKRLGESSLNSPLGARQSAMPDPSAGLSGISRPSSISSILDSLNPKNDGGSMGGSSSSLPSTTPIMQPGPPVLEMPRRKF